MSFRSLPQEVLNEVTVNLTKLQARALAKASRHFYEATMPRWASSVTLSAHGNCTAFCDFMLAHEARPLHLRRLVIYSFGMFEPVGLARLACVVRRAKGLVYLYDSNVNATLAASPELLDALIQHANLKEVHMHGTSLPWDHDSPASAFLAGTASALEHVSIESPTPGPDLSSALLPHIPSLHTLRLDYHPGPAQTIHPFTLVCPQVRALDVSCPSCTIFDNLAPRFPGVTNLGAKIYNSNCPTVHEHARALAAWTRLDHYHFGERSLRLARRIRCVSCDNYRLQEQCPPLPLRAESRARFEEQLRVSAPAVLECWLDPEMLRTLPRVCPDLLYLRLEGLAGRGILRFEGTIHCVKEHMLKAAQALHGHKLDALAFKSVALSRDDVGFEEAFDAQKLLDLAAQIAHHLPRLSSLGFEVTWTMYGYDEPRDCSVTSWFAVSRGEDGAVAGLRRLERREGDELAERLVQLDTR